MAPILIFRHIECEGPGFLGDFLQERKIPFELICIDKGDSVPKNPDRAAGLVFMGGSMSVNDPIEWIGDELALIRLAQGRDMPMLGHCLGAQLIAKALGADIRSNTVREIGWHEVNKVPSKAADDWLGSLVDFPLSVFHWHGETFSIPAGATRILKSRYCENQAFVHGNILAMQCHIEIKPNQVTEWSALYADQIADPGESVQSADAMLDGTNLYIGEMGKVATHVYTRWLKTVRSYVENQ